MAHTFLDGRITVTSLAAPTTADMAVLAALSEGERAQLLREAVEAGVASGVSAASMEDIWREAERRAAAADAPPKYAV